MGATVHEKSLRTVKSEYSPEALMREPRSSRERTWARARFAAVVPTESNPTIDVLTVTARAKIRCMFVWPTSDDHLYGVSEDDGSTGPVMP
jgi:hypothetical protein